MICPLILSMGLPLIPTMDVTITQYGASPASTNLNTVPIQRAIDDCAAKGGGIVRVPAGTFVTGGLQLRSHVNLRLEEGAILKGSDDCKDYGGKLDWSDALLKGIDLVDVELSGPGTLDGSDCRNPNGEEGFRGPHAVWLERCKSVRIKGIKVMRSANWAFNCNFCSDVQVVGLSVRAGHDGFDASNCKDFRFEKCDFRTGDDCIAGASNNRFVFDQCYFNSSCNAFRFSCIDLNVRRSKIKGPGEFAHKISGRTNMENAFIHFSPRDRGFNSSVPHSAKWLIEDCEIDGADCLYNYNFRDPSWQTGQPVAEVTFKRIVATNIREGFKVVGDKDRQFQMTLEDLNLTLRTGIAETPFVSVDTFDWVRISRSRYKSAGSGPLEVFKNGNKVSSDTKIQ